MSKISPVHLWEKVIIYSDCKPLEALMKKPLHNTPQLQGMLLDLQKYDIDLVYLAEKENILVDTFLSHTRLEEMTHDIPEEQLTPQVHMVYENALAMKSRLEEIKEETPKDPGLKKVTKWNLIGIHPMQG